MRRLAAVILLLLAGPMGSASAQATGASADSGAAPRTTTLRRRIEDRFAARVTEELQLTDDQVARLRRTVATFGSRRRELEAQEREVRAALQAQLRPGVAADRDSVAKLTDAWADVRVRHAETFREELHELEGYLDPVQRARFFALRERLLQRIREVRGQHHGRQGGYPRR